MREVASVSLLAFAGMVTEAEVKIVEEKQAKGDNLLLS